MSDDEEKQRALERAVGLEPSNPDYLMWLAQAMAFHCEKDASGHTTRYWDRAHVAIPLFERAISLPGKASEKAERMCHLVWCLLRLKRYPAARTWMDRAKQLAPSSATVMQCDSDVLEESGDKTGAFALRRQAALTTGDAGSLFALAHQAQYAGKFSTAIEAFKEAREVSGGHSEALMIGDCYAALGRLDEALRWYQAELKERQTDKGHLGIVVLHLGSLYEYLGEPEEADRIYRLAPDLYREWTKRRGSGDTYIGEPGYFYRYIAGLENQRPVGPEIRPGGSIPQPAGAEAPSRVRDLLKERRQGHRGLR